MLIRPRRIVNCPLRAIAFGITSVFAAGCIDNGPEPARQGFETISFLGDTLRAPVLSDSTRARLESDLAAAESALAALPRSATGQATADARTSALIWVGRRHGYLGSYRAAIATFTQAIAARTPPMPHAFRHRGHRYITVRELDSAIADFEQAARLIEGTADEVEPDGQPNARGIPTSTLQFNIWYHLGLARYLKRDWAGALAAYERCRAVSNNPDAVAATTYWQYLTLRRLGEHDRARTLIAGVSRDADIIENHAYHRLLLFYKGELPRDSLMAPGENAVQDATRAYGVAMFDALAEGGDTLTAPFARIVDTSPSWAAFGHIAAEAELAARRRARSGR